MIERSRIQAFVDEVVRQFRPKRVVLFGSYAYGQPNEDSDVDLLVIMPARNQHDQAVRIRWEVPAPFPMDLLVRTPKNMEWRLREGDSFLREIMSRGKVLYEKVNGRVGAEGRSRRRRRQKASSGQASAS